MDFNNNYGNYEDNGNNGVYGDNGGYGINNNTSEQDYGYNGQGYNQGFNQGFGDLSNNQDYVNNQNNLPPSNKKHKKLKKKKKGGCLFGILKFFLFIILLIVAFMGYKSYKRNKEFEEAMNEAILMDSEEFFTEKLKEQSDLEGLTVEEKIGKGLLPFNDSDTDRDGLTDKEEIEVYHSDPLKASSSGDSIPDGYKVLHNLDLNKKYSDNEIQDSILFESINGVTLKDKKAENAYCYIRETDIKLSGSKVERAIRIDDYTGKIEIDFSDVVTDDKAYMAFSLSDEMDSEAKEIKLKNGKVDLDIKENGITIGLIKRETVNSVADDGNETIKGNKGIFIVSPLAYILGQRHILIVEKTFVDHKGKDRSEELTRKVSQALGVDVTVDHRYSQGLEFDILKKILGYMMTPRYFQDIAKKTNSEMSDENAESASQMMRVFITYGELEKGEWLNLIELMQEPEDTEEVEEVKPEKPSKYVSTFTRRDIFPFPNLSTYVSPGGNCAGISELTTQVFNRVYFPKEGSTTMNDKSYSYKVTSSELDTLFDKYLDDYKDHDYWKNTYEDLLTRENLSEADQEFIDLIGCKWADSNVKYDSQIRFWETKYDWSEMEDLLEYFENGDRICTVFFHGNITHAINAYGIEQDEDNPDIYRILIYDNNYPLGTCNGNPIKEYIEVKKFTRKNWKGEKIEEYEFDYAPFKGYGKKKEKKYRATNKIHVVTTFDETWRNALGTAMQCGSIDFFDENGELINKSRDAK